MSIWAGENDEKLDDMSLEIDEPTGVPVRHLNYSERPIGERDLDWLKNGRHLDFNIDSANRGFIFANGNDTGDLKLFPFDVIPPADASKECIKFMKDTFTSFKPLLDNQMYKHFSSFDKPRGVLSLIQEDIDEKKMFLRSLITMELEYLDQLIKSKPIDDEWIINYANCYNVLNLINCIYYAQDDEIIILLQNWIQVADIEPDEVTLKAAIEESEFPYKNHSFWSVYVKKMILRGSFANLVEDLMSCQFEKLENDDPKLFELIVNFIALISGYDPITFSLDLTSFLNWKEISVSLRDSIPLMDDVKNQSILIDIYDLLGILSGLNIESNCDSWYECFVSLYLYQLPSKTKITEYLSKSLNIENELDMINGSNTWDSICIDVLKGRFLSVLSGLETFDKFIATFMAILIESSGFLDGYSNITSAHEVVEKDVIKSNVSTSIDSMVNDLIMTLLQSGDKEKFEIGVGIIIECNNPEGKYALSEVLPSYRIETKEDFEWVLSICIKFELFDTMETIYKIQGELLFEKGYLYESIHCFAEGNADMKLISVVWKIFEILLVDGEIKDSTLIERIKSNKIESPKLRHALSPLVSLHEILTNESDKNTWIKRWINLMNFQYLPKYYKPALLEIGRANLKGIPVGDYLEVIKVLNTFQTDYPSERERCAMMYEMISGKKDGIQNLIREMRKTISMEMAFEFLQDV